MENKRKGTTKVTSVSLSSAFSEIIKKFNLSPTEAIRKGIAVELYELGLSTYITKLNQERSEALKKFTQSEDFDNLLKNIKELETNLKKIKEVLTQ